MTLWIGTSGWNYADWRDRFYEPGLPPGRWFERYAEAFATVELNVTFYRQPRPSVFEGWARRAPEGFRFAVKASRFITHVRRLRDDSGSIDRLMDGASRLGPHLGPILLQLPPDLEVAPGDLADTLATFPSGVRVAVEPRHRSWLSDEVRATLRRHHAALCWADRFGPVTPADASWATADWGYLRFHEGGGRPSPCYRESELRPWTAAIDAAWPGGRDIFAYFNNDPLGCALRDAAVFARLARRAGLDPTPTPDPSTIRVG